MRCLSSGYSSSAFLHSFLARIFLNPIASTWIYVAGGSSAEGRGIAAGSNQRLLKIAPVAPLLIEVPYISDKNVKEPDGSV